MTVQLGELIEERFQKEKTNLEKTLTLRVLKMRCKEVRFEEEPKKDKDTVKDKDEDRFKDKEDEAGKQCSHSYADASADARVKTKEIASEKMNVKQFQRKRRLGQDSLPVLQCPLSVSEDEYEGLEAWMINEIEEEEKQLSQLTWHGLEESL